MASPLSVPLYCPDPSPHHPITDGTVPSYFTVIDRYALNADNPKHRKIIYSIYFNSTLVLPELVGTTVGHILEIQGDFLF